MSVHVDGFGVPVPRHKLADYRRSIADHRRLARKCAALWIQRSALEVHEPVMADPMRARRVLKSMPFDGKRRVWGGYKEIVRL